MENYSQFYKEYVYTKHLYKFEIKEYYVNNLFDVKEVIELKDLDFAPNGGVFWVIEPGDEFMEGMVQAYKEGYRYVERELIKNADVHPFFIRSKSGLRDVFVSSNVEMYDKSSIKSFLDGYIKDQWYSDIMVIEEETSHTSEDKNYIVKIKCAYTQTEEVALRFNGTTGLIHIGGQKIKIEYDSNKKLSVKECLRLSSMLEYNIILDTCKKMANETNWFLDKLISLDYNIKTFFYLECVNKHFGEYKIICRLVSEDDGVLTMHFDLDENVFKYAVINSSPYLTYIIKHIDEYNKVNAKQKD